MTSGTSVLVIYFHLCTLRMKLTVRGFSIVFPGQRKKKEITNHAPTSVLWTTFFYPCMVFITTLPSDFTSLSWHDEATAREFQTCFRQRHQNICRKIWNLSASLSPSSLICNILWASCQPLLTEIKVQPVSCADIILYENSAGALTSNTGGRISIDIESNFLRTSIFAGYLLAKTQKFYFKHKQCQSMT